MAAGTGRSSLAKWKLRPRRRTPGMVQTIYINVQDFQWKCTRPLQLRDEQ